MRCPFCGHDETQVKDSRHLMTTTLFGDEDNAQPALQDLPTFERVQLRDSNGN